jgi:hypothetical protein
LTKGRDYAGAYTGSQNLGGPDHVNMSFVDKSVTKHPDRCPQIYALRRKVISC